MNFCLKGNQMKHGIKFRKKKKKKPSKTELLFITLVPRQMFLEAKCMSLLWIKLALTLGNSYPLSPRQSWLDNL